MDNYIKCNGVKNKKKIKLNEDIDISVIKGISFLKDRPLDPIFFNDALEEDSDEEHKENIQLKNPTFWNQFALIGSIEKRLADIVEKYKISLKSDVMKLSVCLQQLLKENITKDDLTENFETIMKNLPCKIIFVSVIPRFTRREYGRGKTYYLIHIRFSWYIIAESSHKTCPAVNLNEYSNYDSVLGSKHTHVPISDEKNILTNNGNLTNIMKILKGKQVYDDFQPEYNHDQDQRRQRIKTLFDILQKSPYYQPEIRSEKESHLCKLFLEDAYSGFAEIMEGSMKGTKIHLYNRKNCSKAFNEDIVNVTIFKNVYSKYALNSNDNNIHYSGRVASVVHSNVQPVNKVFLCHLIFGKSDMMKPICKTIPVIKIDNKYAVEQVKKHHNDLRNMVKAVNLGSLIQTKININSAEIFANKYLVTIKKLNEDIKTTVKEIHCVDSYRCDYIFLVLYRWWNDEYQFPFGDVLGLYTPDVKLQNILNLIKVSCDVSTIGLDEEKFIQKDIVKIKKEKMKELTKLRSNNRRYLNCKLNFCLKYPNKAFNEIAYSYGENDEGQMIIGVHIPNVSKFIPEDSNLDKCARDRFFTFLLPSIIKDERNHLQPDYLFSTSLTTEFLSIQKDKETSVISCYLTVTHEDIDPSIEYSSFIQEKFMLEREIDALSTDQIINNNLNGYYFFRKIYKLCRCLRYKRIKDNIKPNCFYPNFQLKVNETALVIEEELQFLINKKASLIYRDFRDIDYSLLNDVCIKSAESSNLRFSPILHNRIRLFLPFFDDKQCLNQRFSKQFLNKVLTNNLTNLFKCESLFPDVGSYHKKWKASCGMTITDSCWVFHDKKKLINENDFRIFTDQSTQHLRKNMNLVCSQLLSITNPLSCYLDAVLQRILTTENKDDEIKQFERHFESYEKHKIHLDKYWKICNGYEIRHLFEGSSFVLDCVYEEHWNDRIFFHHPFLDEVNHENFFLYKSLNLNNIPLYTLEKINLTWKTMVFLYNPKEKKKEKSFRKNYMQLKEIYSFQLNNAKHSEIESNLKEIDIEDIRDILSNDPYTERTTSEISEMIDPTITLKYCITPRQIMRIQFGYDYSNGIMKIVPELWIINPDFRVCLCHRSDPLKYFMNPRELSEINYERFIYPGEYKYQFIIINRLEGIYQAINCENSFFIHDLKVDWIARKMSEEEKDYDLRNDNYGILVLEKRWCKKRFLRLLPKKANELDSFQALEEAVKRNKMDYLLCVQTFIKEKNVYWIGHCRVSDISLIKKEDVIRGKGKSKNKDNTAIHLTMKLVHSSFPLKHSDEQLYSIEFMETPISSRIFERSLTKLQTNSFPENIVMENIQTIDNGSKKSVDECLIVNTEYYLNYKETIFVTDPVIPTNTLIEIKYKNENDNINTEFSLNDKQKEALNKSMTSSFTLIWGPPGTGKTMVGCLIAYHYALRNRLKPKPSVVLYCGPSNKSVDVVAEKLLQIFGDKCPKLLRIFNQEIVHSKFTYPLRRHQNFPTEYPETLNKIALHKIVKQPNKPLANKLSEFENIFLNHTLRYTMKRSEFADVVIQYEKCLKKAFETEIKEGKYEIILTTAAGSCKKMCQDEELLFSQVILDESGMCTEPEALGPMLCKPELESVVLIGDHKQLRPIITCPVAKGKQLNVSLFERLYKPDKDYCIMLDTQYRMHPSICEFPSKYFYGSNNQKNKNKPDVNLKTARCESWTGIPDKKIRFNFNGLQYTSLYKNYKKDLLKNNINIADEFWTKGGNRKKNFKCYPIDIDFNGPTVYEKILFINTLGVEVTQEVSCNTGSNQSKCNKAEAKVVKFLYEKLMKSIHSKENSAQSVLVITQYRYQESVLKKICEEILINMKLTGPPRVSTVVMSQGSESDYVIFSTVRSLPHLEDIDTNPSPAWIGKYLGFITDENQVNVALTRAKKGLFIIGNSHLLSVNYTWRALIEDLKDRKCFVDDKSFF